MCITFQYKYSTNIIHIYMGKNNYIISKNVTIKAKHLIFNEDTYLQTLSVPNVIIGLRKHKLWCNECIVFE